MAKNPVSDHLAISSPKETGFLVCKNFLQSLHQICKTSLPEWRKTRFLIISKHFFEIGEGTELAFCILINKGERTMSEKVSGIFVDDAGSGSVPVIFVHSLAGNTQQWCAQLDHLRETRRAIAFDLRGHGQSAAPANGDYAIEAMAQDIRTVVDQCGTGSSVGC
ncbi:MAG: alpha/beta fold hydrolase [Chloroflexota bacterium]